MHESGEKAPMIFIKGMTIIVIIIRHHLTDHDTEDNLRDERGGHKERT